MNTCRLCTPGHTIFRFLNKYTTKLNSLYTPVTYRYSYNIIYINKHIFTERSLAIACCPSVCPSLCDRAGLRYRGALST